MDSPVGFFDSGVGGLSVYSEFKKILPHENTIYFGDLKNLPYGNKSQEELICFAKNILNFFKIKKVKAVVIACNTSSALAYDYIKNEYDFKIYPIIQSCAKVISSMNIKKVGVFATVGTVNSMAYQKEILRYNPNMEVKEIACPNWVSIVENKITDKESAIIDIKNHIDEMSEFCPDKIILGCTHYPYLMDTLINFMPEAMFIDPAKIFVEYINENLTKNVNKKLGEEEFYVSANPELFVKNAKMFYEVKKIPQIV